MINNITGENTHTHTPLIPMYMLEKISIQNTSAHDENSISIMTEKQNTGKDSWTYIM